MAICTGHRSPRSRIRVCSIRLPPPLLTFAVVGSRYLLLLHAAADIRFGARDAGRA